MQFSIVRELRSKQFRVFQGLFFFFLSDYAIIGLVTFFRVAIIIIEKKSSIIP